MVSLTAGVAFCVAFCLAGSSIAGEGSELTTASRSFRGDDADGIAVTTAPAVWTPDDIAWRTPIDGRAWSSPAVDGDQVWVTTATEDGRELTGLCLSLATGERLWSQVVFGVHQPGEKHLFNSYASPTPALSDDVAYLCWGSAGLAAIDRATFALRWVRRDLPANHYRGPGSSPILSRDASLLFLMYDGYDVQYVECLDAATGATIWRTHRPIDFETDNGDKMKAYGTPLLLDAARSGLDRDELVCPRSFGCFAYDPGNGLELWRVRYGQFSTGTRPVFADGRLYLTTGFGKGNVVAIRPGGDGDVTDTHLEWTAAKTMPSKPSPVVAAGVVYALNDKGVLVMLDAATGERLHQVRLSGNFSASPLLMRRPPKAIELDDRLLVVEESGDAIALSVADSPSDAKSVDIVGRSTLPDGMLATPVAIGDRLLIRTRSELVCLETGETD